MIDREFLQMLSWCFAFILLVWSALFYVHYQQKHSICIESARICSQVTEFSWYSMQGWFVYWTSRMKVSCDWPHDEEQTECTKRKWIK
jgi:hypothetical protein